MLTLYCNSAATLEKATKKLYRMNKLEVSNNLDTRSLFEKTAGIFSCYPPRVKSRAHSREHDSRIWLFQQPMTHVLPEHLIAGN